ncbi:MAG: iron chelate uptake ABC transporter family permease subunit [Cyanobium sp.]
MVRNPLAEPYILGVSSGASTGAALRSSSASAQASAPSRCR